MIVTSPPEVIEPPTEVDTVGLTMTVIEATLTAIPSAPLKARPLESPRAPTSLRIVTDAAERTAPLRLVPTVPAEVTFVTTTPMPAPSPAESACPSAWPSENDWLRTVPAPDALIGVREPPVVWSPGEFVAVRSPRATPARGAIAPGVTRAKAGATVTVWPLPIPVL